MSCFYPNIGQRVKGSGSKPTIIRPYKVLGSSDDYEFRNLFLNGELDSLGRELETFLVSCGKCIGCRLDYSREWSDRCYLESLTKSPNWFITLTYNDLNLPVTEFFDGETIIYTNSLVKRHVSDFMKRLRSHYKYHYDFEGFSFYGCGEYGSQYNRPHYHLLIFGLDIPDLELFTFKDGFATYNSKIFSSLWGNGFVTINEFSYETASYVARYCLKKQKGEDSLFYQCNGLLPEFSLMSRDPGIGYDYYKLNFKEIFERGYIPVKKSSGVFHSPIPRYFEKLYEKDFPLEFEKYKSNKRESMFDSYINSYLLKDDFIPLLDQRSIDERAKLSQLKALRRNFESSFNVV